jgi:hypothetical protein
MAGRGMRLVRTASSRSRSTRSSASWSNSLVSWMYVAVLLSRLSIFTSNLSR